MAVTQSPGAGANGTASPTRPWCGGCILYCNSIGRQCTRPLVTTMRTAAQMLAKGLMHGHQHQHQSILPCAMHIVFLRYQLKRCSIRGHPQPHINACGACCLSLSAAWCCCISVCRPGPDHVCCCAAGLDPATGRPTCNTTSTCVLVNSKHVPCCHTGIAEL